MRSDDNNAINADNAYPYYAFPDSYLGNQLKSYGGYIKYTVRFLGEGTSSTVPDVIISVSHECIAGAQGSNNLDLVSYFKEKLQILEGK